MLLIILPCLKSNFHQLRRVHHRIVCIYIPKQTAKLEKTDQMFKCSIQDAYNAYKADNIPTNRSLVLDAY
ncbi:MAG TPA: hypothetical protein DCX89_01320 [Saprospirales bacterium]|nr:hypothetical protein [Saprospirales bacterium]